MLLPCSIYRRTERGNSRLLTITSDDGLVFGVRGTARVSGPLTGTPATATFRGDAVMGGVNQRQLPAAALLTLTPARVPSTPDRKGGYLGQVKN